ncbi:MAG TPA: hypothetical protein VIJ13_05745, partial [Actinomycetota bacterium]
MNRQRDERLDRTKVSRTSTIGGALANYENALQGARSLWPASDGSPAGTAARPRPQLVAGRQGRPGPVRRQGGWAERSCAPPS